MLDKCFISILSIPQKIFLRYYEVRNESVLFDTICYHSDAIDHSR